MGNLEDIRSRLEQVFQDTFEDETIRLHDAMTAEDIEDWDSVTHITLVLAVEKEFGIRLSAAAVGQLDNVGAMVRLLQDATAS